MIHTLIAHALMAVFAMFRTVFKTYEMHALHTFALKRSCQKTFLISQFVIDTIN